MFKMPTKSLEALNSTSDCSHNEHYKKLRKEKMLIMRKAFDFGSSWIVLDHPSILDNPSAEISHMLSHVAFIKRVEITIFYLFVSKKLEKRKLKF
jgi:hypothetical protein